MYKITNKNIILKSNTSIPMDNGNRHYQQYLQWVAEGNIPEIDPNSFVKINEWSNQDEYWSKDGEEDLLIQPYTQESWSNGTTTVYDVNDIPTTADEQGNPQLDLSYVYVAPQPDESWTYVPAVEAGWEIVDDEDAIKQEDANQVLSRIRSKRDVLILEADAQINKHIDGDISATSDIDSWKTYRIELRNCTDTLKTNNIASLSTADIDPEVFVFPVKP